MKLIRNIAGVVLTLIAATIILPARAQGSYPEKPIRVIVPFAPGGATDQVARLLAVYVSRELGTTMVVDNRTGANGNIGVDYVAKAPPDGYTVLHTTSSIAFTAAFKQSVGYQLDRDLTPVSLLINQPLLIMSGPSIPVKTMKELIDYGKKHPGKLSYGSSGIGNLTHLAMHVLFDAAGVQATHVPYKGGAAAFPNLVGGQIDLLSDPINSAYPFVRDKKVTALAVTGLQRSPLLPDVPTAAESVLPGFEIGAWQILMVPAGTPKTVVERLNAAYVKALNDPEIKAKLAAQGADAVGSSPTQCSDYMHSEIARWEKVVQESKIRID